MKTQTTDTTQTIWTVGIKFHGFSGATTRTFTTIKAAESFVQYAKMSPLVEGVDEPFVGVVHTSGWDAAASLFKAVEEFQTLNGGAET